MYSPTNTPFLVTRQERRNRTDREPALTLSRTLGDTAAVGITLATIAEAQAGLGQVDDALATFELARAMRRAAGDRQADGIVLLRLGRLAARIGDIDQAERHLTAATEAFEERRSSP